MNWLSRKYFRLRLATMAEEVKKQLGSFDVASSKISEAQKLMAKAHEIMKQEAEKLREDLVEEARSVQEKRTAFEEMIKTLDRFHFSSAIKLNVGGKIFKTTLETLTKDPNSMLSAMFSGRFELKADEEDGAYFIDRDGDTFRYILNYLRNGELLGPKDGITKRELLAEAKFFQIEGLITELEQKRLLDDSVIIRDEKHTAALQSWLPVGVWCTLLYRATRDGQTAGDFHRCCDGKGRTLVVMESQGNIFGGYASTSWQTPATEDMQFVVDNEAFLFTLVNPSRSEPVKIPPLPNAKAGLRCSGTTGPSFGTESYYDLHCQASTSCFKYSLDLGCGFTCPTHVHKKRNFKIDELEVFKVNSQDKQ